MTHPLLPDGDPWQPRSLHKRRPIPLRVEVQTPAKPQVRQQCAVFRQGVSERVLVVENQGSVATDVTQVVCPAGYEVSPTSASLPGNGHEIFKVRKVGAGRTAPLRTHLSLRGWQRTARCADPYNAGADARTSPRHHRHRLRNGVHVPYRSASASIARMRWAAMCRTKWSFSTSRPTTAPKTSAFRRASGSDTMASSRTRPAPRRWL